LIARSSSDRYRGLAMTLWSTFFGVAFALVAWFGIPLVNAYGLESLFLAHAAWLLATAVVLAFWLPSARQYQGAGQGTIMSLGFGNIVRQHLETYKSSFMSAPAIGWLFYTLTFVSLLTVLPDQVIAKDRAFVAGTMPLASIAVSMVCGAVLLPRIKAVNVIIMGFAISSCLVPLLWLEFARSWVCIGLFGTLGLVQGASFAAIPQLNHDMESQVRANGAMAQMGNLGNTIGTPLLLTLLAAFGLGGLILGVIASYCAGIGAHLLLRRRRQLAGAVSAQF
jgi:DHA1 family inner membrane transport protein